MSAHKSFLHTQYSLKKCENTVAEWAIWGKEINHSWLVKYRFFFSKSIYVVNVVLDVLLIVKYGDKWERVGKRKRRERRIYGVMDIEVWEGEVERGRWREGERKFRRQSEKEVLTMLFQTSLYWSMVVHCQPTNKLISLNKNVDSRSFATDLWAFLKSFFSPFVLNSFWFIKPKPWLCHQEAGFLLWWSL